jgi:hypothetical protein
VRIFLNRKRGVPIDDRRHVYRVRLPFMNPRYPNDAAVEFALGGKVAVWQSRRPEIMVYAALVIFGIDSCSGRLTRILKTLRLGTNDKREYQGSGHPGGHYLPFAAAQRCGGSKDIQQRCHIHCGQYWNEDLHRTEVGIDQHRGCTRSHKQHGRAQAKFPEISEP